MFTTKLSIFILISITLKQLRSVYGQLPVVPCPQYFEYQNDGFGYFGKITLPQWPVGSAELRVHTSQRGLPSSNYHGRISPFPNESEVVKNVLRRQGATFRVDFVDPGNPPKLTLLSQDGLKLCEGTEYPPPNSWGQLSYTLLTYYVDSNGNKVKSLDGPINLDNVVITSQPGTDTSTSSTTYTPVQVQQTQSSTYTPAQLYQPIAAQPEMWRGNLPSNPPTVAPPIATPVTQSGAANSLFKPINSNLNAICGMEGPVIQTLVYGGTDIERGQFPWLTAIYKQAKPVLEFKCGGTLLSKRTVISAAHCFKNIQYNQIVLFLGRYNLVSFSEDHFVSTGAVNLILHPNYQHNKAEADLALIIMDPLEQFTQYIRPICMWSEGTDQAAIQGRRATVVGWGSFDNRDDTDDISAKPKMVDVNIATNEDCAATSPAFANLVNSNTICAGNRDGSGPCTGDSGGGLMMVRNGRWVLRGIVSLGQAFRSKCNLLEYVVYCDVAQYTQWIQSNMLV